MSKIFDCQDHLEALISDDVFFGADPVERNRIGVFSQRVGDIPNAVAGALQKLGIGVVVMLPLIQFVDSKSFSLDLRLKFAIAVTENPGLNKTGKPAEAVIEKIISLVHWKPNNVANGDDTLPGKFIVDRNAVQQLPPPKEFASVLTYQLNINTEIQI